MAEFMTEKKCDSCNGNRLKPASQTVYVAKKTIPARELYDYDKDTCRITFPIKETEKEKMGRLERFKKKDNRCLLYIK